MNPLDLQAFEQCSPPLRAGQHCKDGLPVESVTQENKREVRLYGQRMTAAQTVPVAR